MKKLFRIGKYTNLKKKNKMTIQRSEATGENITAPIPTSIQIVKKRLREMFSDASDFVLREVIREGDQSKIILAYIDGLADKRVLNQDILRPLIINQEEIVNRLPQGNEEILKQLKYNILCDCEIMDTRDFTETIQNLLSGDTILYIDGQVIALQLCTRAWEQRGVQQSETEAVVRGPREGFTESLRINTSLLRRKIKNTNLKFFQMKLGEQTNTDLCICYIEGIADNVVVDTVKERLQRIKIDAILESGYIEEFIEDHPYSIFPTVGNTEKPDVVAAKILEGRVAILCDGTPFVLTVPHLFVETFQSSEDYYARPYFTSVIRILRFVSFLVTTLSPALYVALLSFHVGAIPFELLLSMAASREGVPFSSFLEALIMIIAFEFIREAGVRMPRAVGQAVSIVGALILGEAAVSAGIASDFLIIIVSLTAITSFIVSSKVDAIFFIRMGFLIGAQILGMMGIILVTFVVITHMCSLKSFGAPYMAPFAPLTSGDLKDTIVRVPLWSMITRPNALIWGKNKRMKNKVKK